jgi:hypothetical protein
MTEPGIVVVIPAFNEEQRISATVASALTLPEVLRVIVTDDGSSDRTGALATQAGAQVARHNRRRGKAAAMVTGADTARSLGLGPAALLFLDADLEETAGATGALIAPIANGTADLTIAILPPAPGGGHGFVVRLATRGIVRATGWTPTQPLSGQRCITRALFDQVQPLARGFGVETGMTIDALRAGARVEECPVPLRHRVTGTSWRDQRHRARQYRDVWWALARRSARVRSPAA